MLYNPSTTSQGYLSWLDPVREFGTYRPTQISTIVIALGFAAMGPAPAGHASVGSADETTTIAAIAAVPGDIASERRLVRELSRIHDDLLSRSVDFPDRVRELLVTHLRDLYL